MSNQKINTRRNPKMSIRSKNAKLMRGKDAGIGYGNQRPEKGDHLTLERNGKEYDYLILSMPGWFEINGYNREGMTECWHGNPCGLRSNVGDQNTCVITRGLGAGIYNGKKYPKGYCININRHLDDYYTDY